MDTSFRTSLLAGAGGMAVGAALLTALTGRSRPPIDGLAAARPPEGLPPAVITPLGDHGELFHRDAAGPGDDAPTVVLLHGWVVTADLNWFRTYDAVAGVARVIAPDHRGHGRSPRHSQPFRLADVADDVAALIRELGCGPVVAVGYSMGGPIAQLLWQRHPDLVSGLVLCATAADFRFGPLGGAQWRAMAVYQTISRVLPRPWLERLLLAGIEGAPLPMLRIVGPHLDDLEPMVPWIVGELERGDVEDVAEAGRELGRFDSRGWIRGVDVPSAVVVTTRDRLVPPTAQLALASLLDDPLIVEVDGDHDAPAAQPRRFNAGLLEALAHVTARS